MSKEGKKAIFIQQRIGLKMKAKLYIQVECPECGTVMIRNTEKNIRCLNPQCKIRDVAFKAPTVELERVKEDESE